MNDTQIEKVRRFINDPVMNSAVYELLLRTFMRPKPMATVEEKAARFISIEELQNGWKELEKFKSNEDDEPPERRQVGL